MAEQWKWDEGETDPDAGYTKAEMAAALDMNRTLGTGIGEPPYEPKAKPIAKAKPKKKTPKKPA